MKNASLILTVAGALLWSPLVPAATVPRTQPQAANVIASPSNLTAPVVLPPASSRHVPAEVWSVHREAELRDVLYGWSTRAGWSLVWDSEYSYQMQADAVFEGDYVSAVKQLFAALGKINPPLYPQIYQGNRVLVVKAQPNR